jgi:multimeric flavodoxin WrbA
MVLQKILKADCLVFATPVYYFGMSSQLKAMVDRFYARTMEITRKRLKVVLIATSWDSDDNVMKAIEHHFNTIFDYMHFKNKGMILAKGSGTVSMMPSHYYTEAFNVGKSL